MFGSCQTSEDTHEKIILHPHPNPIGPVLIFHSLCPSIQALEAKRRSRHSQHIEIENFAWTSLHLFFHAKQSVATIQCCRNESVSVVRLWDIEQVNASSVLLQQFAEAMWQIINHCIAKAILSIPCLHGDNGVVTELSHELFFCFFVTRFVIETPIVTTSFFDCHVRQFEAPYQINI